MKTFSNASARDPRQAAALAQQARSSGRTASFSGGGTDLLGMVKERIVQPDVLINLRTLKGLDQITSRGGWRQHRRPDQSRHPEPPPANSARLPRAR